MVSHVDTHGIAPRCRASRWQRSRAPDPETRFWGQVRWRGPVHAALSLSDLLAQRFEGSAQFGRKELWLFPGGQPGRPISTGQLVERLNKLGIRPGADRSTALFQHATEIPAAILARTLGIHTDVAVAWQRLSAGDWTNYAAEISRRSPRA